MFHQFRQAKFAYGGSILSSSQFLLPQKMELDSEEVKVDSEIMVSLPGSKSVKLTVDYIFCSDSKSVPINRLLKEAIISIKSSMGY